VRTVNVAGEPLKRDLVNRIYELGAIERVFNLYGPTEDTTYSTYAMVERESDRAPTIGRPVANSQVYILDSNLSPVPLGVVGELFIGGAGIARGYMNRPALTATRFLPNPFSPHPGARLYRTGDLARFLPNGQLQFLGRTDHQVKVRGFRIELGEIEAALLRSPTVREAVVMAQEEAEDGRGTSLVAYVVKREGAEASGEQWRRHLREWLPDYMVPGVYVEMAEMPVMPNGKVDRVRLREEWRAGGGGRGGGVGGAEYVAPEGEVAEELARMWGELLRVERVSAQANFFELGGHSLIATQLMALIQEKFGVRLPLRKIFETSTVSSLAQSIELLLWAVQEDAEASCNEGEAEGEI
jgi:acyl-coenzyme A synthetase/AMP-(fatty) acid ligase/acyl carrier protein